jgi:hypothetical protein
MSLVSFDLEKKGPEMALSGPWFGRNQAFEPE